jgi:lysophospholipase L1-like esterase
MRTAVGLAGALLLGGLLPAPSARAVAPATPEPVRILLLGDSVTQGSAGDWTWRYRLWQHFEDAGAAVDLVGPRNDLWDDITKVHGSNDYVDPDFDTDHAARWGMQVEVPDVPAGRLVEENHPDVVVVMLGVNDLLLGATPDAVARRTTDLVAEIRAADPTADVVLAEATQTWFGGVSAFNGLLDDVASEADEPGSRVVLARTASRYDQDADTWDNSHPNARGEVKIAAAVADALAGIGVGPPADRPLPAVQVGPRTGAELRAVAGIGAATLTWSGPPGATAQYVWQRDVTQGTRWRRLPLQVAGPTWTAGLLTPGHRYRFRLQPVKGDDEPQGAVFSNAVVVVPFLPPAEPSRLRADAGRRCVTLTWREPRFATHYRVARRTVAGWRFVDQVRRPRLTVSGLPIARSWRFRITPWHADVRGDAARIAVRRSTGGCG